jgi:Carboxylesterase family
MKTLVTLLCAGQVLWAHDVPAKILPTTIDIDSGPIVGTSANLTFSLSPVNKYLGIPYAAPVQRFAPAVRPVRWTKPLNASNFGPACIQSFSTGEL